MKKYSIREFADTFGISADALRYYEKNHLLETKRNAENTYRYYTDEDCQTIMNIKMLRSLGFSVKEIRENRWSVADGSMEQIIRARQAEMERQMVWLKLSSEKLRYYAETAEHIGKKEFRLGRVPVNRSFCFYSQMLDDDLTKPGNPASVTFPLFEHMPVSMPAQIIEGMDTRLPSYRSGLLLESEHCRMLSAEQEMDGRIELADCVRVIAAFSLSAPLERDAEIYADIFSYSAELGVKVKNSAVGIIIPVPRNQDISFLDIYLPILEEGK